MDFRKKRVLVTGASSGLGLRLAVLLAGEGATLTLTYRSMAHLEEARKLLPEGNGATFVHLDQFDPSSRNGFLSSLPADGFDLAILNAGSYFGGRSGGLFPDSTFLVNAVATYLLLEALAAKGTSHFLLTSSMNRKFPQGGYSSLKGQKVSARRSYAYSKQALASFPALFPGLDVKVVEPGLVKTNIYGKNAPFIWKSLNRLLLPFGHGAMEAARMYLSVLDLKGTLFAPSGPFRLQGKAKALAYDWAEKEKEGASFLSLIKDLALT